MKSFLQAIVLGAALASLVGCGGGGSGGSSSFESSSSSSSTIPMTELSIQGLVTDGNAVANADIAVTVGSHGFTTKADAAGKYSVVIKVPTTDVNQLVQLIAKGSGAQTEAEFISLLPSLNTLVQQAGGDKLLDSSENFGVNITNVTTAEFGMVSYNLGVPTTDSELQLGKLYADSSELAELAATIKLIVDRADYKLPTGFTSMVTFAADGDAVFDHVDFARHVDTDLFNAAVAEIAANSQLTKPANNNLSVLAGVTDAGLAKCLNATGETALANVVSLNCADKGIKNLIGLGNLTNLQGLNISENLLIDKVLELSANTKLKALLADNNNISVANVSANTSLEFLSLSSNQLKTLDISKNLALVSLYASVNQLSSLNLQQNTKLEVVAVGNNDLMSVDVAMLPKLTYLWVYGNPLSTLDITKNPLLETLGVQDVDPAKLDLGNHTKLQSLILVNVLLESLDVSKMPDLRVLYVLGSNLSSLNLNSNKKLQYLMLTWSYIDKLDLSQLTELQELTLSENELTSLDLSKNTKLTSVDLDSSGLETITGLEFIADKEAEISLNNNDFSAKTLDYLFNLQDNLGYTNLSFDPM